MKNERSDKVKKKVLLISLLAVLLGALIIVLTFLLIPKYIIKDFKSEVTINYNEEYDYNYSVCYGNFIKCEDVKGDLVTTLDSSSIGVYEAKYIFDDLILYQKIKVVDKEGPIIDVENEEAYVCPNGKVYDLKINAIDGYDGDVNDKVTVSYENNKVLIKATDETGNTTIKEMDAIVKDEEAPTISINGASTVYLQVGESYNEEGVTITDNCDKFEESTEGSVDTSNPGRYSIIYKAVDEAGNESSAKRVVEVNKKVEGNKVIYLTFDDGPSIYTNKLLDVLKKYDVKATFFVTGIGSDDTIIREYNEGHAVALHTYSHSWDIYKSVDAFFDDLYKVQERVKNLTGYTSYLMRFAGGSSNTVSRSVDGGTHIMSTLTKEVENRGFKYFDWNVSSGDAGGTTSTDGVYNNVISTLKSDYSVVLQHDIKGFSVDAVEGIIRYGLANGYRFEKLTMDSPGAHHGVNN